ncbi:MAG: ATP-binding protein [Planctomycetes bacterium]|nr:ATP-binding protein [Planctomycetota bacterium]
MIKDDQGESAVRKDRLSRVLRRVRAETAGGAGHQAVHYRVIAQFRGLLESRGRRGWAMASMDSFPGLDFGVARDFVAERDAASERTSLNIATGAEEPVLHDFREHEQDFVPQHVIYLSADFALLAFSLMDADGWVRASYLLAARDVAALETTARALGQFRDKRKRASEEIQVVGRLRLKLDRSIGWDDLVLPASLKSDIRGNVETFFRGRALYERMGLAWKRGFLFVGPPGNGKTLLCRVIAAQAGVPCLYLVVSGNADKRDPIEQMFEQGKRLAPCVLVFEDIDSLFNAPGKMSYFLNQVDGFASQEGLLIVGTTNHPENVDDAILNRPSRFDRVWKIENPEPACRRAYLAKLFAGQIDDGALASLVRETEGFSVTYLKEVFVSAAQEAIQSGQAVETLRILPEHVKRAVERLRDQMSRAKGQFVERIPMGFEREEDEEPG